MSRSEDLKVLVSEIASKPDFARAVANQLAELIDKEAHPEKYEFYPYPTEAELAETRAAIQARGGSLFNFEKK